MNRCAQLAALRAGSCLLHGRKTYAGRAAQQRTSHTHVPLPLYPQAKEEGRLAADRALAAAVAPLQAEVSRLTERVAALQQLHARELAAIEASARQQVAGAQAEAHAAIDRLTAASSGLQRELRGQEHQAEALAADLARAQVHLQCARVMHPLGWQLPWLALPPLPLAPPACV